MNVSSVTVLCGWTLAAVFAVAAFGKLKSRRAFAQFARSLRDFGVPAPLVGAPLAGLLVASEVVTGALAVVAPLLGLALAFALLGVFTLGLGRVLKSGQGASCHCFGSSKAPVSRSHLARNALLMAIAAAGAASAGLQGAELDVAVYAAHAGFGLLLGALITRWDDFAFLWAAPTRS